MTRITIDYPEEQTRYTHPIRVRITDLSAAHHLGFDSLVGLINDASAAFLRNIGMDRRNFDGINIIFADLAVSYRSEAFAGDLLHIDVAVGGGADKGFDLLFRVRKDGSEQVVALAKIGIVCFDYARRRVVSISADLRARLGI